MNVIPSLLAVFALALRLAGCAAPFPEQATVRQVVDGDTIQLTDGRLVRYIGIDTPEVRRRADTPAHDRPTNGTGAWIVDPEPYGIEAMAINRRLVEGRTVRLEYDAQTTDRYGRLLAYVYVGPTMVNAALVEAGAAEPLVIPPNTRYAARFAVLVRDAKAAKRGKWALTDARGSPGTTPAREAR